jgi:pyruvate/2-oxoglutarate dehydrogenase complex dihydrolipoamide dehydrogenase (E3) component
VCIYVYYIYIIYITSSNTGDVIGPPGLASAAQQHGRAVAQMLFEVSEKDHKVHFYIYVP